MGFRVALQVRMALSMSRYQLVNKLATGGMAEVFLARVEGPMGFEKTLVLKRILPHLAEDPQFVGMFFTEASGRYRWMYSE